jgi:GntR family transcriptional regulator
MGAPKSEPLRRHSSQSLYVQLANHLERDILAGRYGPLARLPSELELVARFCVSRITVRQAIRQLVEKRLVEVKQGKGVFAIGPRVQHGLDNLTGFYDLLVEQGHNPKTRLLAFGPASASERAGTVFEAGPAPILLKRLYVLHGKPFALMHGYLLPDAQRITRAQASTHTTYRILSQLLGVQVARADIGIRAREAPKDVGALLKLPRGQHVLVMERTSLTAAGLAVEHSFFYIVPDTYEFRLRVRGPLQIAGSIQQLGQNLPKKARNSGDRRVRRSAPAARAGAGVP